ncbi:MAG: EcsC family protein [Dorea sp.]|nr:EcsC family protein [Dorea sp.]MDY2813451.1 EcsC family protein [Dorea sp.]
MILRIVGKGGRITVIFSKDYWEKEWDALEKQERRYLRKQKEENPSVIRQKISQKIPEQLESTLNEAFVKAFALVFEKGTGIIEKSYQKNRYEQEYQDNEAIAAKENNRKSVKAFARQAGRSRAKNLLISGAEGAGLGVLGIGIPDIPIFTAVLLKSIYEIALSYGFSYDSEEEQCFILGIIETSMLRGERLIYSNNWINTEIDSGLPALEEKQKLIRQAAESLSAELLHLKFLQGIPLVGVAGGLADSLYLKKITEYADLKYRRRFLKGKI